MIIVRSRISAFALACAATIAATSAAAVLDGMDRSVRPGDDFFTYANGAWVTATQIPPDQSSWGTLAMLRE